MRKGPRSAYDKWNTSVVICDTFVCPFFFWSLSFLFYDCLRLWDIQLLCHLKTDYSLNTQQLDTHMFVIYFYRTWANNVYCNRCCCWCSFNTVGSFSCNMSKVCNCFIYLRYIRMYIQLFLHDNIPNSNTIHFSVSPLRLFSIHLQKIFHASFHIFDTRCHKYVLIYILQENWGWSLMNSRNF
jgi:hypothetical protein